MAALCAVVFGMLFFPILPAETANVTDVAIEGGGRKGRLLVTVNGQRGTVCDDFVSTILAEIVCRQLGFNTSQARLMQKSWPATSLPIVMDDVICNGEETILAQCLYKTNHNCKHSDDIGVSCLLEPPNITNVTIEGGGRKGRLLVTVDGETGTVCYIHGTTNTLAKVVCREMGWNTNHAWLIRRTWTATNLPIVMDLVRCTGHETVLSQCSYDTYTDCRHLYDIGISCSDEPPKITNVTIQGGGRKGRLLVTIDGETGTVCHRYGTTDALAKVVCREMGWNTTRARVIQGTWTATNLPILIVNVRCTGNETALTQCTYDTFQQCRHYEDIGISCSDEPPKITNVAIEGGGRRGGLLVTIDGETGTVCYNYRTTNTLAKVVCREMGWNTTQAWLIQRPWTATSLPVMMGNVICTGNETALTQCTYNTFSGCGHTGDIGISCTDETPKVAIEGGGRKGRLLVTKDGETGTVCSLGLKTDALAKVSCRELGLNATHAWLIRRTWTENSLPVMMEKVRCTGNEARLAQCTYETFTYCSKRDDVGISCSDEPPTITNVAIEGGGRKGRLLVTVDGEIGTVCYNLRITTNTLAEVVCRELGFINTTHAWTFRRTWTATNLPILVDEVRCTGKETAMTECTYDTFQWCGHNMDTGIGCSDDAQMITDVAIEGGGLSGRLLVTMDGETGTVCGRPARIKMAEVVCRELGLSTYKVDVRSGTSAQTTLPILISDVRCSGNEKSLAQCAYKTFHYCKSFHEVWIKCSAVCLDGYYGEACNLTCSSRTPHCSQCAQGGGQCTVCSNNFSPPQCTDCPDGFYKTGSTCGQCTWRCYKDSLCDKTTGHCAECPAGKKGDRCTEDCDNNYYGTSRCSLRCGWCEGNAQCDPVTGHCLKCEPGWSLPFCKEASSVDGLGTVCGIEKRMLGYCSVPHSACGSDRAKPQEPGVRVCLCVAGTIEARDDAGDVSCVTPPSHLFDVDPTPLTLLLSNASEGDTVLNTTLLTTTGTNFTKTLAIFPADSFLTIDHGKSHDSRLILYLNRPLPNANTRNDFTVTATVNYTTGGVIVKDVLYLTVNTTHTFQSPAPVRAVFVVDGTRAGSLVFDLLSVLENVEGLSLSLDTDFAKRPFKLVGHLIVCEFDIFLNEYASSDNVGMTMTMHVKSSAKVILVLKVAIIASRFQNAIREIDAYSVKVANFASLVNDFEISMEPTGFAEDFFQLSDARDYVHLTQNPDYEVASQRRFRFDLFIKAREVPLTTTIRADIEVTDVNDEAPEGKQAVYNFTVQQGADEGTIVGFVDFTDSDTKPDQLVYTIVDDLNSYKHLFREIDPMKGALILNQKLPDVYSNTNMEFTVTASDKKFTSQPVVVFVEVYRLIRDIKTADHFQVLEARVLEERSIGQIVATLAPADYTGYSLQTPSNFFSIDQITGNITTKTLIDRENLPENPLSVSVIAYRVGEGCTIDMVGNVTIYIEDINDNPPIFVQTNGYKATIMEHSDVNTPVITVSARDNDIGVNANLRYSLSGPHSKMFKINSTTGLVTVADAVALDRESFSTLQLSVSVTDGLYEAMTVVTVTVINNNGPEFLEPVYNISVWEDAVPGIVFTLLATDPDVGANGEIRFLLWDGGQGYFMVNSSTGTLRTTQPLDRETVDVFTLTVLVFDNGQPPRSATATVFVHVEDVNDFTPRFENTDYYQTLDEGTSCYSTPIFSLTAEDQDLGANGEVMYSIDRGPLLINSRTGQIFCPYAGLDYETEKELTAVVVAKDKGTPALSSSAAVHLTLKDVNDNSPVFEGTPYNFTVHREDNFVGIVYAEDRDSGANGLVTYSIASFTQGGDGLLSVRRLGLLFFTNRSADVAHGRYSFVLTATDGGVPALSSTTMVTVNVLSTMGSAVFTQSEFNFTMIENKDSCKFVIGQLTTTASAGRVSFVLERVFPDNTPQFRVDSTGNVLCNGVVDRERDKSVGSDTDLIYSLYVKGRSSDDVISYAAAKIRVLDVNDNTPRFIGNSGQLGSSVTEGADNGTFVIEVSASDPDYGVNGTVVYSINDRTAPFKINPDNGNITVNGLLDRETQSEYLLLITARDDGPDQKTGSLTLTVIVNDVNDNPPEFDTTRPTSFTLPEDARVGHEVGKVLATDKDLLVNGRINYSVINPDHCPCEIRKFKRGTRIYGMFILKNWNLDYEDDTSRVFSCLIKAENIFTTKALFSELNVTIYLTDVNDNRPLLTGSALQVSVWRDAEVNDVIVKNLTATDADSGQNGALTYTLETSGNQDFSSFSISPLNGSIWVRRSLRDLATEKVTLNVTVIDGGHPPLSDSMLIQVSILDKNTPPKFSSSRYSFSVTENYNPIDAGTVLTVSAVDFDQGARVRCNCTYSIVNGSPDDEVKVEDYFRVNPKSGEVTLMRAIDREVTGDAILGFVVAHDSGSPPKSVSASLTVTVIDVNDNGPQFMQSEFELEVDKSMCKVGNVFYTLRAVDLDNPPFNQFEYSVRQSKLLTGSKYIDVDKTSGELYTKTSELCSQETTVLIGVAVTELDNPIPRHDEAIVKVTIVQTSTNNAPVFTKTSYRADLPYSSEKGTVLNVPGFSATDADDDILFFDLLHGNKRDLFQIDNRTGALTLQYPLDDTIPDSFSLTVTATDRGSVSVKFAGTGTTTVMVFILDPTEETCLLSSEAQDLQSRADQFVVYRALFIALVALLIIAILVSIIFIYKWRVMKTEMAEDAAAPINLHHVNPLFSSISSLKAYPDTHDSSQSHLKIGDPSGMPPRPPRRPSQQTETGFGDFGKTSSGLDSSGRRASTSTADHASDQDMSWPMEDPTPHTASLKKQGGRSCLSVIPSTIEDGVQGSRQSDTYLHPASEAAQSDDTYLHPASEAPQSDDTYLHPVSEASQSDDTYLHPASEASQSDDTYLHPASEAPQSDDTYLHPASETPQSDNYLHLIASPDDPLDADGLDTYHRLNAPVPHPYSSLRPVPGLEEDPVRTPVELDLPPPSPHASHVMMTPDRSRDSDTYSDTYLRPIGEPLDANLPPPHSS